MRYHSSGQKDLPSWMTSMRRIGAYALVASSVLVIIFCMVLKIVGYN